MVWKNKDKHTICFQIWDVKGPEITQGHFIFLDLV